MHSLSSEAWHAASAGMAGRRTGGCHAEPAAWHVMGCQKVCKGLQHGKCWAAHLTGQISAQACVHAAVDTVALGVQACRVTVAEKIRRCPPQCKGQVQHGVLQACQAHCCKAVGAGIQGQPCT